jgi:hypothetical protein
VHHHSTLLSLKISFDVAEIRLCDENGKTTIASSNIVEFPNEYFDESFATKRLLEN